MDPLHAACGGEPTLGESLAVDLIARFGVAIDDIAEVRPLAASLVRRLACGTVLDAPTRLVGWLAARDGGAMLPAAGRQGLIAAWHRCVDLWQRAARRLSPRGNDGLDLVGTIAEWLRPDAVADVVRLGQWGDAAPTLGAASPWDSAATVVLGHMAAEIGTPMAWHSRVVCLGHGALQTLDQFDEDLSGPASVVVRRARDGGQIEWLPIGTVVGGGGSRHDHDEERGRGVWRSPATPGRDGIVDAA